MGVTVRGCHVAATTMGYVHFTPQLDAADRLEQLVGAADVTPEATPAAHRR